MQQTNTSDDGRSKQSPIQANDEWLPYLNWYRSIHSLEFFSANTEKLRHALQGEDQVILGLTGKEANIEDGEISPEELLDGQALPVDQVMFSNCSSILLKRHCDKIIMSTALVKNRGEKQLYLATDFLSWHDETGQQEYLSPLLLYPAQLFYNDRSSTDVESFLLYIDTRHDKPNQPLLDRISAHIDVSVPEFDASQVQQFLLSLAVIMRSQTAFQFKQKIGINVLRTNYSPQQYNPEVHYRRAVDRELNFSMALELASKVSIPELRQVVEVIDAEHIIKYCKHEASYLNQTAVQQALASLSSLGLGNLSIEQAIKLPERMRDWLAMIGQLRNNNTIREWEALSNQSLTAFASISECLSALEQLPVNEIEHLHADHAYSHCLPTLQRARFQHRLIGSELQSLEEIFNLHTLPTLEEIETLCKSLERSEQNSQNLIDTGYFHARKQLSRLLRNGSTNYGQIEELYLKRLLKILHLRSLFVVNEEYKLAFGTLFKGLDTNWAMLEKLINFSRRLVKLNGSETLTAHLLEHWTDLVINIHDDFDEIGEVCKAVKKLSGILQIPASSHTRIDELVAMSQTLQPRLETLSPLTEIPESAQRLTTQTLLNLQTALENVSQQFGQLREELVEHFREELQTTLNWLQDVTSRPNARSRDIENLLKRLSA